MSVPRAVRPVDGPVDFVAEVPGSKSITNRALLCAALATGESELTGVLVADDTMAMWDALVSLGIEATLTTEGSPTARMVGCGGRFPAGDVTIDARLSGTTSRFLLSAATLASGPVVIDGEAPLRARPMSEGIDALTRAGQRIESEGGRLPVGVWPDGRWPERIEVRGATSSQFLSGLLLVAPSLPAGLVVDVVGEMRSRPYIEMTIDVMSKFGARIEAAPDLRRIAVSAGGYRSMEFAVEPDATAATYPWAAAAICGGRVRVAGLGTGSIQGDVGFVDVLERMGATVERNAEWIEVRGGSLRGIDVDLSGESDTAQTLAAVAAFAEGITRVTGIGFIRGKETDRIAAVVHELRGLGVEATEDPDGFTIVGGDPHGGMVRTYDDHRMAMSMALIGLRVAGVEIADPGVVAKTFPQYWQMLDDLSRSGRMIGR